MSLPLFLILLITCAVPLLAEYFWVPPIYLQKWWDIHIRTVDQLHDFLESNTTFLFETPDETGNFNGHPDLDPGSVLLTFNQSSFRNFADKKLYLRFNFMTDYEDVLDESDTDFTFFFLSTPLVKGPYGHDLLFDVATFRKKFAPKIKHRVPVISWTVLYPDDELAPLGYTAEMVQEMHVAMQSANFTFLIIQFDAVHASWSGHLLDSLFQVTKLVLFFAEAETEQVAGMINVPELARMVKGCGLNRTFLRVPESVREFISPKVKKRKRKPIFHKQKSRGVMKGSTFIWLLCFVVGIQI